MGELELMVEMATGGMSADEIATELGVSTQTVYNTLATSGAARFLQIARRKSIRTQHANGFSVAQIAADLGISTSSVYRQLHAMGIEIRRQPDVDAIRRAYSNGMPVAEIIARFGISRYKLYCIVEPSRQPRL